MPRALLSVSDKTGVVDLGRGLASRGFELVSTGGTARVLTDAGLPVVSVSALTGFPEMMDGRVKTLHPALHGGILARRDRPDDLAALDAHGLGLVDIVVVNLYPFVKAAANPATPFDALVEEIDIGGPSLVRAAAKNFRAVLVVVEPIDYAPLLEAIDRTPSLAFRFELMRKAIAHTAAYDTAIAATLGTVSVTGDRFERGTTSGTAEAAPHEAALPEAALHEPALEAASHGTAPHETAANERPRQDDAGRARVELSLEKIRDLRYSENPHQKAAWYRQIDVAQAFRPAGLGAATIHQGKELSYTNLLDLDAASRLALEFE